MNAFLDIESKRATVHLEESIEADLITIPYRGSPVARPPEHETSYSFDSRTRHSRMRWFQYDSGSKVLQPASSTKDRDANNVGCSSWDVK
jgi:hypothetical protein